MTLGQFAVAVGAPPRWVLNARAVLRLRSPYTEQAARRLGLARELRRATGMPLTRAWRLAHEALAVWPGRREWTLEGPDGSVRLLVDLECFLSNHAARLSLAHARYAERRRGRPARRRDPVAAAKAYGVDISLLQENLRRSPEERLRQLEQAHEFFRSARVVQ